MLHFYSRPFQVHSTSSLKKLKLNIYGIFPMQALEPNTAVQTNWQVLGQTGL